MDDRQDEIIIKDFGKRLQKIRLGRNLSLQTLAHNADLSHQFIDRIERGKSNPSLTTLHRLARALEISVVELIGK